MGEDKYKFQKLTPCDDVKMTIYQEAIDNVFNHSDVRNIALSGAYGAGKSSVLESYKKLCKENQNDKERKFLHISLAHFEQTDEKKQTDDEEESAKTISETVLEGKILNQLIHQIPANNIPQTNFKVKKDVKTSEVVKSVVLVMLFLIPLLHFLLFNPWCKYVASLSKSFVKDALRVSSNPYSLIFSGILCFAIFITFVWKIVTIQKNKNVFKKINFQGNEIEIFENNEDSYFDKYLNEVLYLFEHSGANVIVFEDMDRFNVNRIFERLREINTLVNIQLEKKEKPILRFFYLLRDDIFVSKDRTKFFDYIIPIVPVMDSSNSYNQLKSQFAKGKMLEKFDANFLRELSLYVDDMRVLKNIYNEFCIYENRVNTTELDLNKMLAIITYKNIFPRDFVNLQLNKGMVFSLFSHKVDFIEERIIQLKDLAKRKEEEIQRCKKEQLESVQELDAIYNQKQRDAQNNYNRRQEVEKWYENIYPLRKQAIEIKENKQSNILENELNNIKSDIVRTNSKQLKDIITRENIDEIFRIKVTNEIGKETTFTEIKGSDYFPLLKYLIRTGHIDETYPDYMTYFYENGLSRIDKIFLRSVTDKKAKEFTYKLKDKEQVLEYLKPVDFDEEEVLNYDLFEYLLQTPKYEDYLKRIIGQLEETVNIEFIKGFLDSEREIAAYIRTLNINWPTLFEEAKQDEMLTDEQLFKYSIFSLYYSGIEDLEVVNKQYVLTEYISEKRDYLNIDDPLIDKLIDGFSLLEIRFEGFEMQTINQALFEAVYENCLYVIKFSNIILMLEMFYKVTNREEIYHRNCTLVRAVPDSSMAKYLDKNIDTYMDQVLKNCQGIITDKESVAIDILNHETLGVEKKKIYIDYLKTKLSILKDVNDKDLWDLLLKGNVVVYSMENVIAYFQYSSELNNILVQFINNGATPLTFVIETDEDEEKAVIRKQLFVATICCNNLTNIKYREIVTGADCICNDLDITGIEDEKIKILIDAKIVRMTSSSLTSIRENYPSVILYFIENNIDTYVKIMMEDLFNQEELIEILEWDIPDKTKIELLGFCNESISVIDKTYSSAVKSYLLKNNLCLEDLPRLFTSYENWSAEVKKVIVDLAVKGVASIDVSASKALIKELLGSSVLSKEQMVTLFGISISKYKEEEQKELLDIMGFSDYKKLYETRKRPTFKVSAINQKLLQIFEKIDVIYGYEEDTDKPGVYKIIRRRGISKAVPDELL